MKKLGLFTLFPNLPTELQDKIISYLTPVEIDKAKRSSKRFDANYHLLKRWNPL